MTRNLRTTRMLLCLALALPSAGCATKYEDLLAERDDEISLLQSENASLRAENEDLRRRGSQGTATPVAQPTDDLDSIRRDLPPEVSVDYTSAGLIALTLQDSITFDLGSIRLQPGASSILGSIASKLRNSYAGRRIYVAGHTDTVPISNPDAVYKTNTMLSAARAEVVRKWLVQQGGLAERNLAIIGFGPFDPVALGDSEADRARNRRVQIVIGENR